MPQPTVLNAATGQWVHAAAIADPTGGTTTDTEGRTTIGALLAALRAAAVIGGATALPLTQGWNAAQRRVVLCKGIADPTGGTTTDTELRSTLGSVLAVLRDFGIIDGGTGFPTFVLDGDTHQWSTTAVPDVSGGATLDAEGRIALNSALAAMRLAELIA